MTLELHRKWISRVGGEVNEDELAAREIELDVLLTYAGEGDKFALRAQEIAQSLGDQEGGEALYLKNSQ